MKHAKHRPWKEVQISGVSKLLEKYILKKTSKDHNLIKQIESKNGVTGASIYVRPRNIIFIHNDFFATFEINMRRH